MLSSSTVSGKLRWGEDQFSFPATALDPWRGGRGKGGEVGGKGGEGGGRGGEGGGREGGMEEWIDGWTRLTL